MPQKFPTTVLCFPGILVVAHNEKQLQDLLDGEKNILKFTVAAFVFALLAVPLMVFCLVA